MLHFHIPVMEKKEIKRPKAINYMRLIEKNQKLPCNRFKTPRYPNGKEDKQREK